MLAIASALGVTDVSDRSGRKATYKVTAIGQGRFAVPWSWAAWEVRRHDLRSVDVRRSLWRVDGRCQSHGDGACRRRAGTYTITFSGAFGGVTRLAAAKLIVK